ncbi:protein sidekick-1 isoform X2 [Rattus norvegicus]|uniref:Sidekick cell adhesion molecule 1 n=1 Tax=Rattus norvegicus TaxID=10116 RepID=A0ABK0LUJ4_RAT
MGRGGRGGRGESRRAGGRTFSSAPGGGGGGRGGGRGVLLSSPQRALRGRRCTAARSGDDVPSISPLADNFSSARLAVHRSPDAAPRSSPLPQRVCALPPPCPSRGARGWRLRGMARARPSVAGGGGAAPPERAGPGRPRRSRTGHHCDPERPGLRAAPRTPGPGAGRRSAKLRPGRGWWALLLLQLHLLRALAQDDVAPYFKTEPGLPQIHLEGNRLVLTCLAEGSWPLEFKWIRNDSELTAYSSEYRYIIPSLQKLDAGFYRCVVRNRMGALLQRKSEIQVAYMGNFMDADQRKTVSQGHAALLNLLPITSCPRPQVTWFREGHKIIPSSRIAITLENQLVILATTASDAGAYYVQAVNERNGENKTSPFIHLSVARDTGTQEAMAPVIVVAPGNRSVVAGSSETTLECIANARPVEELSVHWKRNGVRLTSGLHSYGRRLTIINPTSADTGMYVCEATLRGSAFEPARAKAFLSIIEPPYFTAEPESRILGEVEETVDIPCRAMGVPLPTLQWYKDAVPLSKLQNPRYRVLPSGGLHIQKLSPEDSGIFQCFANNEGGEIQTHTYLDVTNIAPAFTQRPVDTTVTDGMTAVLRCEVSGAPKPAITWKKGNHILASGSVRIPRFMLLESGGLRIAPVFIQDAGNYACYATNTEASVNASAMLTVWNRTSIVHPPEDRVVIKGTTATLCCGATHDPRTSLRYVWKKDNAVITPSSSSRIVVEKDGSLVISQTWSGDIGDYTCEIVSEGGNDSRTARLEVIELPHPPQNLLASLSSARSHSVTLSWVRPFDGNSPVLYYIVQVSENNSPWKVHLSNVGPEMAGVTVSGLTPARTYQFRVCAVNQVGKGQYSTETSRLMLPEEPPSAPPKNIVASGRTNQSIMVQWQPPPETEHNGVLRGYILRYRLAGLPGEHQQRNISSPEVNYCLVTDLIIWTQYEIQVAAYNGAGLGVFSRAVTEYTLQGGPGAVGHLSFTEILDTSLKVSWQEPLERNGIITGYQISWEVYGRNDSRLTHTLNSTTHEYKIQGLSSLTTYTIDVAAMTTAGVGLTTSSTISSGVPPDLPGAPSNLVISNISPRSATLQFRPGYDGKTAICRWIVEGQVGAIGDEEEWVTLYEEENEPDAQMLEIPNLTPYTHYRFRMKQVNIVGPSPFSQSSRVIQTLQAPPDVAPTSLTVRTASETSLRLRWVPLPDSQYNGNPESVGYRVKYWRSDQPSSALAQVVNDRLERELTIEELEEWTEYELRMQAFNAIGAGPWSELVRGRTRESVPSASPENVSAEAVSSTQILLTWASVPEQDQNGLILGYKVLYRAKDLDPEPRSHVVRGNHTQSALLAGLRKFVVYELQVLAFTRIGNGVPSSPLILERTKDDTPGPPVRLVFPEVRLTAVRIVWQPPEEPNGVILGYQIAYRLASGSPHTFTTVEVGATVRQFTATELAPESAYIFRLSAKTRQGWGEPLEATVITTEKRERPAPPRELLVPQAEVTARSLRLQWVPGSDGASPIRYFTVQVRELPGGEWQTYSSSISHEATLCAVERLRPFTSYKLRLKATNDIGDSDFSAETEAVTTLQDVPGEPPGSVSATPHTTSSVLIQWQPPRDESLNGLLQGYRIYYRELESETGLSPEPKTLKSPSALRAELTAQSSFKTVNSSSTLTTYELTHLKKYRRYEVIMTAYNIIGESPASVPVEVFVGEAAPAMAPQNIQVTPLTASQLEVTWDPPPPESQNGNIQGYKVYYWEADSRNETEKMKVLFLPEPVVKIKDLTSHTKYLVSISAFNAAGDGPRSDPCQGRTHQAAPGPPSFLEFSEITSTTLNVSWGEPSAANGILQGYRVVYEPLAPVQGVSKVVTVDVKGNWQRWLKVRDLTKGVTYFFRVQARTIAYGPELQANVTAGPAEGSPGSPRNVLVTKSASELTLQWTEGNTGNTPTTGYVIEARPSDEGLWDMFAKDIPRSATSYTVGLDKLRQGVTYEFRVVAVNKAGFGEPSRPSIAVSAQAEAPFYEEWWFLLVIALSSLLLVLLVVFVLVLHGQSKKYKNCGSGKGISNMEETVTLDNGGFAALELNSRHLNVKSTFSKKNGTRSPPRPSPGGLHYSDEDICNKYNGAVLTESVNLKEKSVDGSESEASDSDYEEALPKHSFVNHYMSDPTYYNSWKRRPPAAAPHRYEAVAGAEAGPHLHTVITTQSAGGVYTPAGPGARAPLTGFSSFV